MQRYRFCTIYTNFYGHSDIIRDDDFDYQTLTADIMNSLTVLKLSLFTELTLFTLSLHTLFEA